MRPDQILVSNLVAALLAVTLNGVLVRGRGHLCWSFLAYLVVLLIGNQLSIWWPELFYTHRAWNMKTFAYAVLRWGVAFEMALMTFAVTRRARRRALIAMGLVVALAVVAATLPSVDASYLAILGVH